MYPTETANRTGKEGTRGVQALIEPIAGDRTSSAGQAHASWWCTWMYTEPIEQMQEAPRASAAMICLGIPRNFIGEELL